MYRITTYIRNGKGWILDKKYLYDDYQKFDKQRKYHKEKMTKPLNITGLPSWASNILETNRQRNWPNNWRVVSEELVNGQWNIVEDWILK